MNILIANDDGISSKGLSEIVKWAQKAGNITVSAPKHEQSGKSQSINIVSPFEVTKAGYLPGTDAYCVDSTPADCVRYAIKCSGIKYDLVISGINRGFNLGKDILYSGTVGAIYEAAFLGVKGIAVSTDFSSVDEVTQYLDSVYDYFIKNDLLSKGNLYNVNIPKNPKGILITRQGDTFYDDNFVDKGNSTFMQVGYAAYTLNDDLSFDTNAVMNGYISITPLTAERTDMDLYKRLSALN